MNSENFKTDFTPHPIKGVMDEMLTKLTDPIVDVVKVKLQKMGSSIDEQHIRQAIRSVMLEGVADVMQFGNMAPNPEVEAACASIIMSNQHAPRAARIFVQEFRREADFELTNHRAAQFAERARIRMEQQSAVLLTDYMTM